MFSRYNVLHAARAAVPRSRRVRTSLPPTRWSLLIAMTLMTSLLMGGCKTDCASRGTLCEGDTLVLCYMQDYFPPQEARLERACGEDGMVCVDIGSKAFCAAPDPDCKTDTDRYCKGDTIVYCSSEISGFATAEMPCTPHACVRVEGFAPVCATPDTPCYTRPDGQYCWEFSQTAYECYQKGMARENSHCNYCYVGSDGKATNQMTGERCLPPRQ